MGRRSGAGGKPIKARRRKAATQSRPSAPKAGGRRKPSSTGANTKLALLKRERDEALEQRKATAEVLRVISASPGDLIPDFCGHPGKCNTALPSQLRRAVPVRGDALHPVAMRQRTVRVCRCPTARAHVSMTGTTVIAEVECERPNGNTCQMPICCRRRLAETTIQHSFDRLTGARSFVWQCRCSRRVS